MNIWQLGRREMHLAWPFVIICTWPRRCRGVECTFANLGGELDAVEVRAPGAAAFCHSTFRDNPIISERSAVIAARGADARLRDVTFSGNSGDGHLLLLGAVDPGATQHAAVYSDEPREVCLETALRSCERTAGAAGCERGVSSPVPSFPASQWPPTDPLLASTDPWLQGTRKVRRPPGNPPAAPALRSGCAAAPAVFRVVVLRGEAVRVDAAQSLV